MSESQRSEHLPCGVALAPLIDQVADRAPAPRPEHQAACSHCQATVTELEEIWEGVRELAREEVVAPERVVEHVIRRIREEFGPDGVPLEAVVPRMLRHALLPEQRGTTRIADTVIDDIARQVAKAVPGVHALGRGARALTPGATGVSVEVSGNEVTVELSLVVEYGAAIPDVATSVRATVIQAIGSLTGLEVVAVDIRVGDVHLEERQ